MAGLQPLQVGQSIQVQGRDATIRYLGSTHFAAGDWVGVELDTATGKNDGAVQGERYFDCPPAHGMFVRPAAVTVVDQPTPTPKINGSANLHKPRTSTVTTTPAKRQSMAPTGERRPSSISNSPTPGPRPSPTKMSSSTSTVSSGTSTPRSGTSTTTTPRARPSISSRQSMAPPPAPSTATRASRSSISTASANSRAATTSQRLTEARRPSKADSLSSLKRHDSHPSTSQASQASDDGELDFQDGAATGTTQTQKLGVRRPSSSADPALSREPSSPTLTQRAMNASTANGKEVESLRTKLRLMEKKRMEDREKLKTVSHLQADKERLEGIIHKLQTKYQPQQHELAELRKELKETYAKAEKVEAQHAEQESAAEMATLDREMAEETAEMLKAEVEDYKLKIQELTLEAEILRDENKELGEEMSPEEKTSQGWMQMTRENDRLREALVRLRDLTQDKEMELKSQVNSLEEENQELPVIKGEYEETKQRLGQVEDTLEDLRAQLDTALGAEEMIETLTEKNMALSEQMEEMKVVIDELESLKELNDEIENAHVSTEKDLQEIIDWKEGQLVEKDRQTERQNKDLDAQEYTLSRFRELVANMHSDLQDYRASQQMTEAEAEDLSSRSRAMMDLNMKLQLSVSKAQVKTIDLELRRLEAQEAAEHLAIVQLFLPEAYHAERDSVLALLRFQRVAFKAGLIRRFVQERIADQALPGHQRGVFAACDVAEKLTWVCAMCERFVNSMRRCSTEQFARFEGAVYELEPVERALNGWIDGLKTDELKEGQCAAELQRTMALMSHLAEVHLSDTIENYADDVHMRVVLMQSQLENMASALSCIKDLVSSQIPPNGENEDESQTFSIKLETLIHQSRSWKVVVGKGVRSLDDLRARSLSPRPETSSLFEEGERATRELAEYSRRVGEAVVGVLSEEGRTSPPTYSEVQRTISDTTSMNASETEPFSAISTKLRSLGTSLSDLTSVASDLSQTIEFERAPAPWVVRAEELRTAKIVSADTEEEISRLKEDLRAKGTELALRDKTLEEDAVKIELLESRMRDASKKGHQLEDLEQAVRQGKAREKDLTEAIESQVRELRGLEADVERWKRMAGDKRGVGEGTVTGGVSNVSTEKMGHITRDLETMREDIKTLQSTVRHLRDENRRLRITESDTALAGIDRPLLPPPSVSSPSSRKRISLLRAEARDVLQSLRTITAQASIYEDSRVTDEDRHRWRPVKDTAEWHVAEQRRRWEAWKGWEEDIKGRVKHEEVSRAGRRGRANHRGKKNPVLATIRGHGPRGLRTVTDGRTLKGVAEDGKPYGLDQAVHVRIESPETWQQMGEDIGFAS